MVLVSAAGGGLVVYKTHPEIATQCREEAEKRINDVCALPVVQENWKEVEIVWRDVSDKVGRGFQAYMSRKVDKGGGRLD